MNDTVVTVDNLSKKFKVYKKPRHRLLEWATFGTVKRHEDFWALRNISFRLKKGESLGIVGPNGAGKSTLLKILTGALSPTTGSCVINGRVVSLLELGTGFHPELTGLQNIYNSTSLLGFEPDYVNRKLDDIIEFSGLADFLDKPVKTYSSGMYVRLAFSLFANLEPDVYIVDEALAVGDVFFQQKCYSRLEEMRNNGVSIILVSHDPAPIVKFCDHAMVIDSGNIAYSGNPAEVLELYQAKEYAKKNNTHDYQISVQNDNLVYGNMYCEIEKTKLYSKNTEKYSFVPGEKATIEVHVKCSDKIAATEPLNIGIQIKNRFGLIIYGTNTHWNNIKVTKKMYGDRFVCSFNLPLNLGPGEYTITVAVSEAKRFVEVVHCWVENIVSFSVEDTGNLHFGGLVNLPVEIGFSKCGG